MDPQGKYELSVPLSGIYYFTASQNDHPCRIFLRIIAESVILTVSLINTPKTLDSLLHISIVQVVKIADPPQSPNNVYLD